MCGGALGASRVVCNDESTTTRAAFLGTMLRGENSLQVNQPNSLSEV